MKKERTKYYTNRGSMMPFYDIADKLMNSNKTFKDIFELTISNPLGNKKTIFVEDGRAVKFSECKAEVLKRAKALSIALKDIPLDSFVAFKMVNSIEWPLYYWAILCAGYKPLLINPILVKEDTAKLIKEAGAKAIVLVGHDRYDVPSINIKDLKLDDFDFKEVWANEIAFCTSGTTGDSRIFVYDGNAISHQIYSAYDMPEVTDDIMYVGDIRLLAVVPFSHIFGFMAVFTWFTFFGMSIVFPKSNNPDDLKDACVKHKVTHIFAVPLFFDTVSKTFINTLKTQSEGKQKLVHKIMDYKNDVITKYEAGIAKKKFIQKAVQRKILGDRITYCISGGSALSGDTLKTMNGIGYNLYNGYGMTEIGITSVELSPDVNQRNKGSVGKSLHGVEYKLLNGELLVKSPYLHIARLSEGKRLEPSLDKDGYFHTGDMAIIDEEGYVYIKGKMKDVVIGANGENIYPDEIETKFSSLPFVTNLSVLGVKEGNEELLTLVLYIEDSLSNEDIDKLENEISEINQTLPFAMQIRRCYISKKPLPMNASMKIKKYELLDEFASNRENFIKLENGLSISFDEYDEKEVKEIVDHIIDIFADVLFIDKKEIAPSSNINLDLNGDSFSYMSIVSSIEAEFNIKFPSETIGRLLSPNQFALYILKNRH